jgi:uncharacterized membrane protein YfcA
MGIAISLMLLHLPVTLLALVLLWLRQNNVSWRDLIKQTRAAAIGAKA